MKHKILRFTFALLLLSLVFNAPRAQQPTAPVAADRIALYQAMLDLASPWTVMCVAAHPDDEDGTSLIVMRHKYGAHTVSLFSTFGEGGQNAIGPELYEEMGAIRARETMAAAEIQGSEPHFLGLKDFGFSKTRDEAFRFWGHEEALRRMVLEIRKLRPDVIITNHSTTSNDHGQHQATAVMVVEAFDAAADANKFPEQLKDGVTTWQVQRLFVRQRGSQAGSDQQIVTIDPNEKDPVRGVVFAEEALRALQKHATQGPWPKTFAEYANRFRAFSGQNAPTGQLPMIRYALVKSAQSAAPMPEQESHNFLDGMAPEAGVGRWLDAGRIDGRPLYEFADDSNRVFARLLMLAAAQPAISANDIREQQHWDEVKRRLSDALIAASGLKITLSSDVATPNSDHVVSMVIKYSGVLPATITDIDQSKDFTLNPGQSSTIQRHVQIPGNWAINLPLSQHLYDSFSSGLIVKEHLRVKVQMHPAFVVSPSIELDVAPPIEITNVTPSAIVITPQTETASRSLTLKVVNHRKAGARTSIEAVAAPNKSYVEAPLVLGADETRELRITLPSKLEPESRTVTRQHASAQSSSAIGIARPPVAGSDARLFLRASDKSSNEVSVPFAYADAHIARNLNTGYIRGFDFSLPTALNALGVESKELSVDDVRTADLSKYTSIIVDNRVYESKPELIAVNQKLLDFTNAGGTLIVFYHKSDEWNPDPRRNRPQLAPYKLILGGERVTDENAPITFLEPDHPLLNTPNRLGQDDFKNWIQERGLYYPRDWDPQFHALLQANDPGENPLKGGLLVADYGKGHYIYTSMVWYRELRGGIPGAYRMLANMISYGR